MDAFRTSPEQWITPTALTTNTDTHKHTIYLFKSLKQICTNTYIILKYILLQHVGIIVRKKFSFYNLILQYCIYFIQSSRCYVLALATRAPFLAIIMFPLMNDQVLSTYIILAVIKVRS